MGWRVMEVFRGSVHKRRVRCIEEMFLLKLVLWSETECKGAVMFP